MQNEFQDFDIKSMCRKFFAVLRQDYTIKVFQEFSCQLILQRQKKYFTETQEKESKFIFEKDLERDLKSKVNSIRDSESRILSKTSSMHENFISYINSLSLPTSAKELCFPFVEPKATPELVYLYDPELKGSKIVKKESVLESEKLFSKQNSNK